MTMIVFHRCCSQRMIRQAVYGGCLELVCPCFIDIEMMMVVVYMFAFDVFLGSWCLGVCVCAI